MTSTALAPGLLSERPAVESALERLVPPGRCAVSSAMHYAVMGGGQRLRPILAFRVGTMLESDPHLVMHGALGVELIHCASLIIDDLPCMDDEALRRGRPAVHRQFGQATALLAAFSLVGLAARQVIEAARNAAELQLLSCFQAKLLRLLDCDSLVGGQAMDLASESAGTRRVAELKTAPLFALAAAAGALGARTGGREASRFGREFGIAYQMLDDLLDGDAGTRDPFAKQIAKARHALLPYGGRAAALSDMLEHLYARSL